MELGPPGRSRRRGHLGDRPRGSGIRVESVASRRVVAAGPRAALRAPRGCSIARRAGLGSNPVHATGRRLGATRHTDQGALPRRRRNSPGARNPRRPGMAGRTAPDSRSRTEHDIVNDYRQTATTYLQGSRTMPGEFYTSSNILAQEIETIFARDWSCVGRASRLERPGDYFLCTVAEESIIVVRDGQGTLRAFFNVCRHRGTRICRDESGHFTETIQCPYHAWTYGIDGRLVGAPQMQEVEGFDKRDYPLHPAAIAEWEGFLFVSVAREPKSFEAIWAPMRGRLARFGLPSLR